jgi:hypothetical protein
MLLKEAVELTGGLSFPGKMPCPAYSLPATSCNMGSNLSLITGTVCSKCYARKGRYCFRNVSNALKNRLDSLKNGDKWVEGMVVLINHYSKNGYFRWHDSGDIIDEKHYAQILSVVNKTPKIKHRLHTKEWNLILKKGVDKIPSNLNVCLSAPIIDSIPIFKKELSTLPIAITYSDKNKVPKSVFICPATTVRHTCDNCRECWKKTQKVICFVLH